MKAIRQLVLLIPLLFLTACHSGQRREMLALLDEADSLNRAYAQLPADSLLRRAADFFDRHGSRNEQVRAHYLLGCAYRDQGQAPEALQAYQDAIDRADTTARDSIHNSLLCRVHSQMAYLFYQQNLVTNQLEHIDSSIVYALKAGDSVAALNSYMFTMGAYIRMGVDDSVMAICDRAYNLCHKLKQRKMIAQNAIVAVPKFLAAGQYQKSAFYLDLYEKESGFFDPDHNIAKGREVYYYLKGLFYLFTNQIDSAEIFFRKELSDGKDFNNQNGGARGLAMLYQKTGRLDSAIKYASYSYSMNDSVYKQMSTETVQRVKSLYDYSHHQERALSESKRAAHERKKATILIIALVVFTLFVLLWGHYTTLRRNREIQRYRMTVDRLNASQTELLRLRSHESELAGIIDEKEKTVDTLLSELEAQRMKNNIRSEEDIRQNDVYLSLHKKALKGQTLSNDEWNRINIFVIEQLPVFHEFISKRDFALSIKEYRMCTLFRLEVKAIDVSHLLEVAPSFVTKMSKSVLKKLFNCDGTTKDLAQKLLIIA